MQLDILNSKLVNYRPYGHPDTLCPEGRLWEKMEGWESWTNKPWQLEFHNAGADNSDRLIMSANGVGKTLAGAAETAIHLTGLYPDWWQGRRFEEAPEFWVGSISNEMQRDYTQKLLLGGSGEDMGTGFVPKMLLVGNPPPRQAGISGVVDHFYVRHISGKRSKCMLKTYEQGWDKWQSGDPKGIWADEEPRDSRIFEEIQTRVFRSNGILYITYTPLFGQTDLTRHFMYPEAKGIWWTGATWDDVPHLSEEEKTRRRATYPDHVVEARTMGVPMMGEGKVYPVREADIRCDPFDVSQFPWFAQICGVDFGMDHPAAAAWLLYDRGNDVIYVTDCYRQRNETPVYHAEAIKRRGIWIPVAWPHDGHKRGAADGPQLKDQYMEHGINMLGKSARYGEKGGRQDPEPAVWEILERMKTGRFKVFSTLHHWWEEFRSYHRKDGRLVDKNDDIMKATIYAVMMKRYAQPPGQQMPRRPVSQPILSMR